MGDVQLLMLMVASVVLVYSLVFVSKIRSILIYSIPAINILAGLFVDHRIAGGLHPGQLRVLLLIGFILLMVPLFRVNDVTAPVLLFVVYLYLLVPLASVPSRSLDGVTKVAVSLLMFPVGYAYFRSIEQLRRLHLSIMVAVTILLVNFGLAQIFKIGRSAYIHDNFVGGSSVAMSYIFVYALLMMPLMYQLIPTGERTRRVLFGVALFTALIALLLIFRRGALLGLVGGLTVLTALSPSRRSARLLKFGVVGGLLFLLSSRFYLERVQRLFEQRGDIAGFVSNTERGRMAEFAQVTGRMLDGSLGHALFGSEPFNSTFALETTRPLHVDYMSLLSGTGLIGLFLYLVIHLSIAWGLFRRARRTEVRLSREIRDTGLAIMAASLTISFSSQIYMISPVSMVFLYLGALTGVLTYAARPKPAPQAAVPLFSTVLRSSNPRVVV